MEQEKRILNVSFQRVSPKYPNNKNARLIIPNKWLKQLGITEKERKVEVILTEEGIFIKKFVE